MKQTLTLPIVLLLASCARIENTSQMKRTSAELPGTANLRSVSNVVVLASPGVSAKLPPHKQWKLVFSDEFEGDKLDDSKWTRRADGTAFIWNGAKGRLCEDHAEVDGKAARLEELFDGGDVRVESGICRLPYKPGETKLYLVQI